MTSIVQLFSNQQQNQGPIGSSRHSSIGQGSGVSRPLFNRDRSKVIDSFGFFDPSEFPSLIDRESDSPQAFQSFTRSIYDVITKQPTPEPNEFTMSKEDFPALRGPPSESLTSSENRNLNQWTEHSKASSLLSTTNVSGNHNNGGGKSTTVRRSLFSQHDTVNNSSDTQLVQSGVQTSKDGRVTNIPSSMVTDQFGLIGLLSFIRAAETDPNLVSLALGYDLTTLNLDLNSETCLHSTFGGPWAKIPCRPQDLDHHVPFEYLTNSTIREKLAPVRLHSYKDDVLFFMLYNIVGDVLQLAAAAELYNRDWRYHKEDKIWITRAPGMAPSEKTSTYERGTYYFFDVTNWRKVPKEFHLVYDKLEVGPSLPSDHFSSELNVGHRQVSLSSNNVSAFQNSLILR